MLLYADPSLLIVAVSASATAAEVATKVTDGVRAATADAAGAAAVGGAANDRRRHGGHVIRDDSLFLHHHP
jgi:hypothetical protein